MNDLKSDLSQEIACSYLWLTSVTGTIPDILCMFHEAEECIIFKPINESIPINAFFYFSPAAIIHVNDKQVYKYNETSLPENLSLSLVQSFESSDDYQQAIEVFTNQSFDLGYNQRFIAHN